MTSLYLIGVLIYIIGINFYVYVETRDTCSYWGTGEITPKTVRIALLWPIFAGIWFIKVIIWVLNFWLGILLLAINCKYKETRVYKFIDKKCG